MTMAPLATLHALLPGSVLVGDGAVAVGRVHSDSRSLQPGDCFVALRGGRFDGHDFLPQARAGGAVAAIAEHGLAEAGLAGLQVADTEQALTELARAWRSTMTLPLIAVAGSNGKTTVTQMIAAVLHGWLGEAAFATAGNLNNHLGVPLTLLRLRQDTTTFHRAGVVEVGMNHPGEIAALAALVEPAVALVNNAQREHQEYLQTVEAAARENGAAVEALGRTGVAVFPADDAHAGLWHALAGTRPMLTFALQGPADVTGHAEWVAGLADDAESLPHWALLLHSPAGSVAFRLHVAGWHNVKNALAASACALAVGCPLEAIGRGLEAFRPVAGRSQVHGYAGHDGTAVTLIDDSYNANPDSVRAAIDLLAGLPGPRWLVLGDMGEVGDQGPAFHAEIGLHARERGIERLWTAGGACRAAATAYASASGTASADTRSYDDAAALVAALGDAPPCRAVLVKGSRFMRMERVVAALLAGSPAPAATDTGAPHAA
jgi:UDP-N-acetylmuramoyl-tripeptide--D-alanyl-D-alanine ligase